jgi:hypothetical protein
MSPKRTALPGTRRSPWDNPGMDRWPGASPVQILVALLILAVVAVVVVVAVGRVVP